MLHRDDDRHDERIDHSGVSLLGEGFAGINGRFHLAGAYTLVVLLLRITVSLIGEDAEWFGIIMLATVLAWGIVFGILGVAYHVAAGRRGKPSFIRYAAFLFIPLVWLQLRLELLAYAPPVLALWGYYTLAGPPQPLQEWSVIARFWIEPFAGLLILILSLYSTPLCIHDREQGQRGAPIRQGLKMLRECPAESRRLLLVVLVIAALGAIAHFLHGPATTELAPGIPEGLILFATSYLSLVVFFAATRVVLARRRPGTVPGNSVGGGPALSGPTGS